MKIQLTASYIAYFW